MPVTVSQPVRLTTTYQEKDQAKAHGAKWDGRSWFAPPGTDLTPLARWIAPEDRSKLGLDGAAPPTPSATPARPSPPRPAPQASVTATPPADARQAQDGLEAKYGRSPDNAPQMTVAELIGGVRDAIMKRFQSDIWVVGQVTSLKEKPTIALMELVDPDQQGPNAPKIDLKVFGNQFRIIQGKLEAAAGAKLSEGMNVRVKIRIDWHNRYHLSAQILDIDPSVTVGAMEMLLRQIREKLKTEGLWSRNKDLPAPRDFTRICVVHPRGASGFADFSHDAAMLEKVGLCTFTYVPATFEGDNAERQIIAAMQEAWKQHEQNPFDALCIIRGGGSKQSLMTLSTEPLARAVCQSPIPVFSGIGHNDDTVLIDEVAHRRFDTPSKIIGYIRETIVSNASACDRNMRRLHRIVRQRLDAKLSSAEASLARVRYAAQKSLTDLATRAERNHTRVVRAGLAIRSTLVKRDSQVEAALRRIEVAARRQIERMDTATDKRFTAIAHKARNTLGMADRDMDRALERIRQCSYEHLKLMDKASDDRIQRIQVNARRHVERAMETAAQAMRLVDAIGPDATLARGFALVFGPDGCVVGQRSVAAEMPNLTLRFRDGDLPVTPAAKAAAE